MDGLVFGIPAAAFSVVGSGREAGAGKGGGVEGDAGIERPDNVRE